MLTDDEIRELLTKGKTGVLKGFKNKQGKRFDAALVFDADFNTGFVFPEERTVRHPPKEKVRNGK